jgi:hypothetical protein
MTVTCDLITQGFSQEGDWVNIFWRSLLNFVFLGYGKKAQLLFYVSLLIYIYIVHKNSSHTREHYIIKQ